MKSSSRQEAVNRTAPSLRREEDRTPTANESTFMTVVLLDREHRGQADQAAVVGEDPHDVGAAADLAVAPLKRVGASDLAPVVGREGIEGQDVLLGCLEERPHRHNDEEVLELQPA
jgi:hypothetical protein